MALEKTVDIAQILFITNPENSRWAGPALWVACKEVQRFYAPRGRWLDVPLFGDSVAHVQPSFRRHYVSPEAPDGIPCDAAITDKNRIESILAESVARPDVYDHALLGPLVHEMVGASGTSVVITDVEILPPPEWRYMIWDVAPRSAVISIAPLDPAYWVRRGLEDGDRVARTKSRARAAAMTVIGSLLGIGRCHNEHCYMLAIVDSVLRLDEMTYIGPEHGVKELVGRTFSEGPTAEAS
jgi:hypothetical protein